MRLKVKSNARCLACCLVERAFAKFAGWLVTQRPCLTILIFVAALAILFPLAATADSPDFRFRPLLAGKASLTEPGFVVRRELGVANVAPELRLPVELVYRSADETSGAFGFAWRCPQLESSVRWSKDSLLWTTPWGEESDDLTRSHGDTENGHHLSERGARHEVE